MRATAAHRVGQFSDRGAQCVLSLRGPTHRGKGLRECETRALVAWIQPHGIAQVLDALAMSPTIEYAVARILCASDEPRAPATAFSRYSMADVTTPSRSAAIPPIIGSDREAGSVTRESFGNRGT